MSKPAAVFDWLFFENGEYRISYEGDSAPSYEDAVKLCETKFGIGTDKVVIFELDVIDPRAPGNTVAIRVDKESWEKRAHFGEATFFKVLAERPSHRRRNTPNFPYVVARREKLVDSIIKRLNVVNFIQLRGSPACGKSTLLRLIQVKLEGLGEFCYRFDSWHKDVQDDRMDLEGYEHEAIRRNATTSVLIDEGQATYTDIDLWTGLFKRVADALPGHPFRIIVACSYGSAMPETTDFDSDEILPYLNEDMRVNLRPTSFAPTIHAFPPLGLAFEKAEVDDYISMGVDQGAWPRIDQALRELIDKWSDGYIALISAMMEVVGTNKNKVRKNEIYTLKEFKQDHPLQGLLNGLVVNTHCGRLLPKADVAADPRVNRVFAYLMVHDHISSTNPLPSGLDPADIRFVHRLGLLYMERMSNRRTQFSFSFPLQKVMLQLCLEPPVPDLLEDVSTLYRLVTTVIRRFNPNHLQTQHDSNEATALEALYQHEFYRCLYHYRPRAMISPEYGTKVGHQPAGRIDFLVHPAESMEDSCQPRSWGIELLKDGDRLAEHAYRFSPDGAYHSMVSDGITEFMIVDFRKTTPTQKHSQIKDLLHAVFSDDYKQVTFFDNELMKGPTFDLTQGVTD
ncbi:hypothetical protein BT96DRAFT_985279 [Gymnopus androsaceus JB14]|uniref:Uncharacterized protein n=1 Tax=Gymnopus androsaceus JB14 TaxID=1447944 RepID=A0A6A4II81_9AGAR|nr:hypothetical protein BT96DRAFT_985279 [Gymnopus androsaceus JB14]